MTKASARAAGALAVLAALSLGTGACGGGSAPNAVASLRHAKATTTTQPGASSGSASSGQSGPTEVQLLKYAECIRSHGVSDFPDPVAAPGGGFSFKVQPDADPRAPTPQFQAAEKACQKDVPPSLANLTPAKMAANALKYSQCMRSHGEPTFPEPDAQGLIRIVNPTGVMSPGSPQFQAAEKACQRLNNGGFDEEMASSSGG